MMEFERHIEGFLIESNMIEDIADVSYEEVAMAKLFLRGDEVTIYGLSNYVHITQPGAELRNQYGLDVRVGNHLPPSGGPAIREQLELILELVNENHQHPYHYHQRYEALHPFTDGNGRSGRLLWAWQMVRFDYWPGLSLGFLHAFYYQALEFGGER